VAEAAMKIAVPLRSTAAPGAQRLASGARYFFDKSSET
jgi:hypothetical protein